MARTTTPQMSRAEHARVIDRGIELDVRLFTPLTLDSILAIERQLQELEERTGNEYVVVPVGQPYGGPKKPVALPREDVEAAHRAYLGGLRGVSPEVGRAYDLSAERRRLENPLPGSAHYSPRFLRFLGLFHP